MSAQNVAQVVDVGANVGDFGIMVRDEGFEGPIHSFEPLSDAFELLVKNAASDPLWQCHQVGIGDTEGRQTIHRSANLVSSSLLDLNRVTQEHDPSTGYVDQEEVAMTTLDAVSPKLGNGPTWLKLDVQGYELHALRGGTGFLNQVVGIDCEVSLIHLYEGQPLIEDMVSWLRNRGFVPSWIEPGVVHKRTGALLQADMTFERIAP